MTKLYLVDDRMAFVVGMPCSPIHHLAKAATYAGCEYVVAEDLDEARALYDQYMDGKLGLTSVRWGSEMVRAVLAPVDAEEVPDVSWDPIEGRYVLDHVAKKRDFTIDPEPIGWAPEYREPIYRRPL